MKIFKDSVVYLLGELFAKAMPFLLMPYLTRKLGAAGFGELSFYQTIFALAAILLGLSQDGALTRYYHFYGKRNLANLLLAGYAHTLLWTLAMLGVAWYAQSWLLAIVLLATASQTLLANQLAWRQCQQRAWQYAAIQIGSSLLTALLTVILLEMSANAPVLWRFVAILLANAAVAIIAWRFTRHDSRLRLTRQRFRLSQAYVYAFGLPLILHHASGFIKGQLDRMVIYQQYSATDLGLYAAALQLASALSIVLMALNKATVPHFYAALKSGSLNAAKVRHLAWWSLLFVPLPALLANGLPESLFTWFLGQEYVGVKPYIILFLLGFACSVPYYLLVNYLFYHGKTKIIAPVSFVSAIVYLLALWLTARHGLTYIPYATIIGNLAILPILYYFVRDTQRVQAA